MKTCFLCHLSHEADSSSSILLYHLHLISQTQAMHYQRHLSLESICNDCTCSATQGSGKVSSTVRVRMYCLKCDSRHLGGQAFLAKLSFHVSTSPHFCVSSRCKPVVDASNLGLSIVHHTLTDVHRPETLTRYPRWARAIASCGIESPVLSPVTGRTGMTFPKLNGSFPEILRSHDLKNIERVSQKHTGIIKPRKLSAIWGYAMPHLVLMH